MIIHSVYRFIFSVSWLTLKMSSKAIITVGKRQFYFVALKMASMRNIISPSLSIAQLMIGTHIQLGEATLQLFLLKSIRQFWAAVRMLSEYSLKWAADYTPIKEKKEKRIAIIIFVMIENFGGRVTSIQAWATGKIYALSGLNIFRGMIIMISACLHIHFADKNTNM